MHLVVRCQISRRFASCGPELAVGAAGKEFTSELDVAVLRSSVQRGEAFRSLAVYVSSGVQQHARERHRSDKSSGAQRRHARDRASRADVYVGTAFDQDTGALLLTREHGQVERGEPVLREGTGACWISRKQFSEPGEPTERSCLKDRQLLIRRQDPACPLSVALE